MICKSDLSRHVESTGTIRSYIVFFKSIYLPHQNSPQAGMSAVFADTSGGGERCGEEKAAAANDIRVAAGGAGDQAATAEDVTVAASGGGDQTATKEDTTVAELKATSGSCEGHHSCSGGGDDQRVGTDGCSLGRQGPSAT
jgi:hypothetical protein